MTVTIKQPALLTYATKPHGPQPTATGLQSRDTYFSLTITFPPVRAFLPVEVPDERLFQHIVWSGSLDWLAEPGEDVYTVEDGEPL